MLFGDPGIWLARFQDVERRLVNRLPAVWPFCTKGLDPGTLENEITRRLVFHLRRDPETRRLGAILSQFELLEEQRAGDVVPKGYIDIVVIIDEDPDCYVAFECKRLNVAGKRSRASLAGLYVKKGMLRYIRAQYAKDLPMGCMLGYVMDGDVGFAKKKIRAAINTRAEMLKLLGEPVDEPSFALLERFVTSHRRDDRASDIEIRHSLLPVIVIGSS